MMLKYLNHEPLKQYNNILKINNEGKYLLLVITMMIRPYIMLNMKPIKWGIIHHSNYIRWFEEARIDYI